jgi:ATP-dependent RNA helicase HrpA
VNYGRIDPVLARELFIRRALVEGDWETRHAFVEENGRLVAEVEALEDRARRRGLLAGDDALFAFFDARVPADVVSGAHFDRWWRDERRRRPDLLTYTREVLVDPAAADALDQRARPTAWKQGDLVLPLTYRFEPGAPDDGVTVHVPLTALGSLRPIGFDWLVPAFRLELVTALMRGLPKELRKPLVPVPDVAAAALARLKPRTEPLLDALSRELEALRGVRIPRTAWDVARLPPHLRMTFSVEDEHGRVIACGDDLAALREEVAPRLRAELSAAHPELERRGLTTWDLGTLPREIELRGSGVRAYPALVDEGATAGVRVLETREAQADAMALGTRRLLLLTVPSPLRGVLDRLPRNAQLALAGAPHGGVRAVLEDAETAAIDALVAEAGGPAWDEASFRRLRDHVAGELSDRTTAIVGQIARILDAARDVRRRLEQLTAETVAPARRDVAAQVDRLIVPGFATASGAARLPDVERYLQAAARRLERLPDNPARDLDRMRGIQDLEALYRRRLDERPPGRPLPAALREVPWMLEELRVSHFAQGLGTRGPVSAKRIRRVLEEAAAAPA